MNAPGCWPVGQVSQPVAPGPRCRDPDGRRRGVASPAAYSGALSPIRKSWRQRSWCGRYFFAAANITIMFASWSQKTGFASSRSLQVFIAGGFPSQPQPLLRDVAKPFKSLIFSFLLYLRSCPQLVIALPRTPAVTLRVACSLGP